MARVGVGPIKDQRSNPLRISCSEQQAHRAAFGDAEQRGTIRAGGVHHGANIIHAFFERGDTNIAIGEPGAALIEYD